MKTVATDRPTTHEIPQSRLLISTLVVRCLIKWMSSTISSRVSHDSTQSSARLAKSTAVPRLIPAWL
jgi:hypothetical protein